jgi:hypothetical protein
MQNVSEKIFKIFFAIFGFFGIDLKGIAKRNSLKSRVFYFLFEFEVDRNVVVTSYIAIAVKLLKNSF